MVQLGEVYGITSTVPTVTYVDRNRLDDEFRRSLRPETQKHIVIHGASKQGKTTLRKKNLPDTETILIQCRPDSTVESLYREILRTLEVAIPEELTRNTTTGNQNSISGSAGLNIGVVQVGASPSHASTSNTSETVVTKPVGVDATSLGYVASHIKQAHKWCVIEDFHYLSEEEKERLAYDLKSFWDLSVFFIIVGIWTDENILTYYNSDLDGRYVEIDLRWTYKELSQVSKLGEQALGIKFTVAIREAMYTNAMGNVGLMQRLLERYCLECGILETCPTETTLGDRRKLTRTLEVICRGYTQRYRKFAEVMMQGFTDNSGLRLYEHIAKVCVEASEKELTDGLYKDTLLQRIQVDEPHVRLSDLSQALNNLDRLQISRNISPVVISYDGNSQRVQLLDRELLFYMRYGKPTWPWQQRH